ncbi:MAG: hypothetical protein KC583_15545, partial [Myxococcales bacterium]|nr:hypothetical protein [Myxococcales bacterium]
LAALCRAELTPRAETWWREGREQAERIGRATVPLAIEQLGPLAALPGLAPGRGPLVELLHRPVERHAESVGTSLTARKQTLEGLAASGAGEPFDLMRIANVTAFMPDGPAGALLRAAARVAREGAWLVEAGTVALGGEAVLTALALARNTGGVWSPRELWLSPAGTPTFLARGGAELPAVLGPAGPPLVRALVQADRALRSKGAEPDAPTMAAALQSLGHRASSAAGLPLVGLSVTT